MHWRHIKWRPPWRKRHLSVLEKILADDAAAKKAYEKEKQRVSTARRNTLARLENRESSWQHLKRLLRRARGYTVRLDQSDVSDDSSMSARNNIINFETGNGGVWWPDVWEGDYEDVLEEYAY